MNGRRILASGLIPVGTSSVRVSVFGTTPAAGGPDGYMDNVDFRISNEAIPPTLSLTVNRDTGALTMSNQTGRPGQSQELFDHLGIRSTRARQLEIDHRQLRCR